MSGKLFIMLSCVLIAGCRSAPEVTAYAKGEWKAHPSVAEEFRDATVVFVGKVAAEKDVWDQDGFISGTFYQTRAVEVLKGNAPQMVELYSENSSGRFPMDVGTSYLIFACKESFEGIDGPRLAINACGNSSTAQQAGDTISIIRRLSR